MAEGKKMWLEERDEMRLVVSKTVIKKWAVSGQHLKITVRRCQIGGKAKRHKKLDRSTVLSMLCIFYFSLSYRLYFNKKLVSQTHCLPTEDILCGYDTDFYGKSLLWAYQNCAKSYKASFFHNECFIMVFHFICTIKIKLIISIPQSK